MMDVRGAWKIIQSNGPIVQLHLEQELTSEPRLSGTASFGSTISEDIRGRLTNGEAGAHFFVRIQWSDNTTGTYHGTFGPIMREFGGSTLIGTTIDEQHPSSQATWVADKKFVLR